MRRFESDGQDAERVSDDDWSQLRRLAASCGELASLHASLFLQDLLRTEIEVTRLWPPWSTILIGWFVVIAGLAASATSGCAIWASSYEPLFH
jgi:DMSO/TMAO reductase YedYZ heme-binding membrane subunit